MPFVVGCIRSGTTMLRLMLDSHPDLTIPPESYFSGRLLTRRNHYERDGGVDGDTVVDDLLHLPEFAAFRRNWALDPDLVHTRLGGFESGGLAEVVRRLYRVWAESEGKPRYGDKTPVFVLRIEELATLLPEARFIHLIRDGRDVVGSVLDLRHRDHPSTLAGAAQMWARCIRAGQAAQRSLGPERYREVRYEKLVEEPEAVLRSICAFIDLEFSLDMLRSHERGTAAVPTHERWQHANVALPPTIGLRDWRRDMSHRQIVLFEAIAGRELTAAEYERSIAHVPLSARAFAAASSAGSAARRIASNIGRRR